MLPSMWPGAIRRDQIRRVHYRTVSDICFNVAWRDSLRRDQHITTDFGGWEMRKASMWPGAIRRDQSAS